MERILQDTIHGSLTIVVQDSRVIQMERHEKYQFPLKTAKYVHNQNRADNLQAAPGLQQPIRRIQTALAGIQFGQVVVKVQAGRVVQIDRTEKQRLPEQWIGVGGEGI